MYGAILIVSMYNCNEKILNSSNAIDKISKAITKICKMTILHSHIHQFKPQGVSSITLVEESHVAIHTWPETKFCNVVVYTCGDTECLEKVPSKIANYLKSDEYVHRIFRQ
jgi:S-adenosylmethionine decarboxylase proenzyme